MSYSKDLINFIQSPKTLVLIDEHKLDELFTYFYQIYDGQIEELDCDHLSNNDFDELLLLLSKVNIEYESALENFFLTSMSSILNLIRPPYSKVIKSMHTFNLRIFLAKYCNNFYFGYKDLDGIAAMISANENILNASVVKDLNTQHYTVQVFN